MKRVSSAALALALLCLEPMWAQIQGQWASAGTMQSPREFNAQAPITGGKVLAMGGVDKSNNLLSSAEIFSPSTGKWTLTGSMLEAREYFPSVVLKNGMVLVSGGVGANSAVPGDAELYNPTTGAWSPAGSLSVPRYAHTATLLANGEVLVAGGCTASGCSSDTAVSELYSPTSNTWTTTGSLNTARSDHTALLLKTGKVLVVGGSSATGLRSCELFNPASGTWSNAASLNTGRYLNATTLLSDGKVLVTGGADGRFPINSAEIYDPTANTRTPTAGAMTIGRYAHTGTLLTDGTVLVAGGYGQSISCGKACTGFIPTNKVDIFNEGTGKFTAAANLSQSLAYHSTTLLASGRALEAGGTATTATCCIVVNTASDYTPLTLTLSATGLNFGLLQIGLSTPSQTVTVANVSSHSVKFRSIASSGDYAETNSCPSTMNAGQNCTITVKGGRLFSRLETHG